MIANRFAGQAKNGAPGLRVEAHLPGPRVLAADNWWGCNGGPGALGCDAVQRLDAQPGVVTAPWLVLRRGRAADLHGRSGHAAPERRHPARQRRAARCPRRRRSRSCRSSSHSFRARDPSQPPESMVGGGADTLIESDEPGLAVGAGAARLRVREHHRRVHASTCRREPVRDRRRPPVTCGRRGCAGCVCRAQAFRFDLSEPARVTFTVERAVRDRRSKATRFAPSGGFATEQGGRTQTASTCRCGSASAACGRAAIARR